MLYQAKDEVFDKVLAVQTPREEQSFTRFTAMLHCPEEYPGPCWRPPLQLIEGRCQPCCVMSGISYNEVRWCV